MVYGNWQRAMDPGEQEMSLDSGGRTLDRRQIFSCSPAGLEFEVSDVVQATADN